MSDVTIAKDIREAIAGDQSAWERLYEKYRAVLMVWASGLNDKNHLSQRDILQDVWIRVYTKLTTFRGGGTDQDLARCFYSWLKRIAQRTMINVMLAAKAQKRQPRNGKIMPVCDHPLEDRNQSTPSSVLMREEQHVQVNFAVDSLEDPLDREIIKLHFWDELPLKLIAEILALEYTSVRRRCRKALGKLQQSLA